MNSIKKSCTVLLRRCGGSISISEVKRGLGAMCILLAGLFASAGTEAANGAIKRVTAGQFQVEPATLQALGFEWYVQSDDNRNAVVAVSYRRNGESAWRGSLMGASSWRV